MTTHTPTDSLIYINREVADLLESADEEIHGVNALDRILETEELPEHVQLAVFMINHAVNIIRAEARLHGASNRGRYDNGNPTTETRQEKGHEPQEDGTELLVFNDVSYDLYPDGEWGHPLFREPESPAAS